jgi:hypothetical protein
MHTKASYLAINQINSNFIKLVYAIQAGQDNPGVM